MHREVQNKESRVDKGGEWEQKQVQYREEGENRSGGDTLTVPEGRAELG